MERNEILKIYGTDYKEMTKHLLERAGLEAHIGDRGKRVALKPNLVSPTPPMMGATTHAEVLAGIIEYLQEHGFSSITLMEGSWVGDRTADSFEVCGYQELIDRYGVTFIDTQKEPTFEVDARGLDLKLCRCVKDADFLINVPVMKGHGQTKITCALKNMKGLIPNSEKRHFHTMGLHKPIGHLNSVIKQDFIVVDHICGDLDFEDGGNPTVCNCVMAGVDPVLIDSYVCKMMHYDISEVPYVGIAESLGCGSTDIDHAKITVCGRDGEPDRPAHAEDLEVKHKVVAVSSAVCEIESCSACYGTLLPVLDRLREEGLLDTLLKKIPDHRIHIGQGFQGQKGHVGIGRCTKDFEFSVAGCPPKEDAIYRALKDYLGA